MKVGDKVIVLGNRHYTSVNSDGDKGVITEVDEKANWCVRVQVKFNGNSQNWENVKYLKQI